MGGKLDTVAVILAIVLHVQIRAFQGLYSYLLFADIKHAYDTADHDGMLLASYLAGIVEVEWRLLQDFLAMDSEVVALGGCISGALHLRAGIPQGRKFSVHVFTALMRSKQLLKIGAALFEELTVVAQQSGLPPPVQAAAVVERIEPVILYAAELLALTPSILPKLDALQCRWAREIVAGKAGVSLRGPLAVALVGWQLRLSSKVLFKIFIYVAKLRLLPKDHPTVEMLSIASSLVAGTWWHAVQELKTLVCEEGSFPDITATEFCADAALSVAQSDPAARKALLKQYKCQVLMPLLLARDEHAFDKSAEKQLYGFGICYKDLGDSSRRRGWSELLKHLHYGEWALAKVWAFVRLTAQWPLNAFCDKDPADTIDSCPHCGLQEAGVAHILCHCPYSLTVFVQSGLCLFASRAGNPETFLHILFHSTISGEVDAARVRYVGLVVTAALKQHLLKALSVPYGHCLERRELEDLLLSQGAAGRGHSLLHDGVGDVSYDGPLTGWSKVEKLTGCVKSHLKKRAIVSTLDQTNSLAIDDSFYAAYAAFLKHETADGYQLARVIRQARTWQCWKMDDAILKEQKRLEKLAITYSLLAADPAAQAKLGEEARQAWLNSQHYSPIADADLSKVKQSVSDKAPHLEYLCNVLRCDDLSWCVLFHRRGYKWKRMKNPKTNAALNASALVARHCREKMHHLSRQLALGSPKPS
ncbi:hypothetical protein AK812_SmicGene3620 [Symbiodinium microadriaticum]|uniref:Reverse transcriptase domain-containing protein n=1 Tax=Symbiodinium microadriaticum TaxID=2951 RepID=A0A1Q9EYA1_SYMMI|nr:hypothetical protein AK812_SmicGene3620 [Symbiodinium microadriaticum]